MVMSVNTELKIWEILKNSVKVTCYIIIKLIAERSCMHQDYGTPDARFYYVEFMPQKTEIRYR